MMPQKEEQNSDEEDNSEYPFADPQESSE